MHAARHDSSRVVLEGLHGIKHAIRFGAELDGLWSDRPEAVLQLARDLAPDILPSLESLAAVPAEVFAAMAPRAPETRVIAVARRPHWPAVPGPGPVVLLDRPRHPGNLGAVIRVAAAAEAAAVWCLKGVDPWSATALRGAAGLHFALPVQAIDALPTTSRPVLALDDRGIPLDELTLPRDGIYVLGSERDGLSADLRERAEQLVAIPMRPLVSSLNLATAAAVLLYALRPGPAPGTGQGQAHFT